MNIDKYIIINKEDTTLKLNKLKKLINKNVGYADQDIYDELDDLLSSSVPLAPEIEKSWDEGQTRSKGLTKEGYLSQLKLDI